MKPFKLIIINGRRWFQKSAGNTYHSVTVTVKHARWPEVVLHSGIHYGYGDQYLQTAAALLHKAGYFSDDYSEMCKTMRDEKTRGKFHITVADVPREKDL